MNLEPFLLEHPLVSGIAEKSEGFFPSYIVLAGRHRIRVTHVPAKSLVNTYLTAYQLAGNDIKRGPWVFVAATRWHDRGLVRQRVDQGLREAIYSIENP